ncbi:helix-turn-helix transcriptional regulator [Rhizobium sp. 32-5/1]|uniref:helix-turn-helix domain-containing protein n=1 Tax=Rhizobium sp. 32-5/1 TaxID=3019602 RepID=UPI00240D66E7|nr:helix-turn-helix transcriptional regulator [Rhizobium sp. 32-5/1]WEZ84691.1 helix-turn-helix transcriptional regulator [Rhizobium sp. 32-5/1]
MNNGLGLKIAIPEDDDGQAANPARLGIRLRLARQTRGMTLKALADAAHCSESLLSKIENGKASPSLPMLHRLVGALDTNIGWMFEESDGEEGIIFRAGTRPLIALDPLRRGEEFRWSGSSPIRPATCSSAISIISRKRAKVPVRSSMPGKRSVMCWPARSS